MVIRTLVLSGGAYKGLYIFGALKHLIQTKHIKLKNIKHFYGSSVGCLIAVMLSLKLSIEHLEYFIVKKDWSSLVTLTPSIFFDMIDKKGLYGREFFEEILNKLFLYKGLSKDITMKEFHDFSKKTNHFYTMCANTIELEEISHLTHPDMKVVDAVYQCCALPFVFQPVWRGNSYYMDGNFICPYPIEQCLAAGHKPRNVLGVKLSSSDDDDDAVEDDNIFKYGMLMIYKILRRSKRVVRAEGAESKSGAEKYQMVYIPCKKANGSSAYDTLSHESKRVEYIDYGENAAKMFLQYRLEKPVSGEREKSAVK